MKHTTLTIFFVITTILCSATEFKVLSFEEAPNDLSARRYERKDVNDIPAALIKVRTDIDGLIIVPNSGPVGSIDFKDGEYWVYVQKGERQLSFRCDGYIKKTFEFNKPIKSNQVYILELTSKLTLAEQQEQVPEYVVIETNPKGAEVLIDGEYKGLTPWQGPLYEGAYNLELRKDLYKSLNKQFKVVVGERLTLNESLVPNFGWIKLSSIPEQGAEIILDGEPLGRKTPYELKPLALGLHQVRLRHPDYEPVEEEFYINSGENQELQVSLKSNFGTVKISTDLDADILVDNRFVSKGTYNGRLTKGLHTIEIRKQDFYSEKINLEMEIGQTEIVEVSLKPKTGTLSVVTTPIGAEVRLNNELKGTAPIFIRDLKVGKYQLELSKKGHATFFQEVDIFENQTTAVEENLASGREITISSKPSGAVVVIDGESIGKTPLHINASFGKHKIELKNGDFIVEKEIDVSQISTTSFEFNVEPTRKVFIRSTPKGASFFIDQKFKGTTDSHIKLRQGTYDLLVTIDERKHKQKIEVTENTKEFHVTLKQKLKYFIRNNYLVNGSPYGIRMGAFRKNGMGVYFGGDMSGLPSSFPNVESEYLFEMQGEELIDFDPDQPYYYKSTEDKGQLFNYQVVVGAIIKGSKDSYVYGGLGYGYQHCRYAFNAYYFDDSFKETFWVKDIDNSASGVFAELGYMGVLGPVIANFGFSSIMLKQYAFQVGIGYCF